MPEPSRITLTAWAALACCLTLALSVPAVPGLPWPAFLFPLLSLACVVNPAGGSLAAMFLAPVSGVIRDFVDVPYFAPAELVIYAWAIGGLCRRAAERRFSLRATSLDPWIVLWLCVFASSGIAELRLGDALRQSLSEGLQALPRHFGAYLFDHRILLRPIFVPLAGLVAYCAVAQSFPDASKRRRAGDLFLAAGGCVAFYALIQFLFDLQLHEGYRVRGGLVAVNLLGSFVVLGLGLALGRARWIREGNHWIGLIAVALLAGSLLVIRSRAAWIGAAAAVSIYLALRVRQFSPRTRKRIAVATVAVIAGMALLAIVAAQLDVADRYQSVSGGVLYSLNPEQIAPTVQLRAPFWTAAVNAIRDYPVFGVGLGRFWSSNYIWEAIGRYRHAHNIVLDLTAELGLVGLATWLLILFAWLRSCIGELRNATEDAERIRLSGILAGVGGFLVTGITDDPLAHSEGQIFFWTALALGMPLRSAQVWTPLRKRIAAAAIGVCVLSLALREPRPMAPAEREFLKLPQPPAASGSNS